MNVFWNAALVTVLGLALSGCKIAIINPEGGSVHSLSGTRDCAPGQVCTFDVDSSSFSESFTAVPAPGYEFEKWMPGERFICDDSSNPTCILTLSDDAIARAVVHNPETFYAMPKFVPADGPASLLTASLAASQDDGEERGAEVHLRGVLLNLKAGTSVGLRFPGILLPQGAIIRSAHIDVMQSFVSDSGNTGFTIRVEDAANAAPYALEDGTIDGRTYGPQEYWPITQAWSANTRYQSVDLGDLVQYVVLRGDWEPGNAMAFQITSDGAYDRRIRSFESSPVYAPKLVIEFAY